MSHKIKKTVIVASESPDLYTTNRILTEARKLKYSSAWINPYEQMVSSTQNFKNEILQGLYFHRTTGIRFDDFDLSVSEIHQRTGLSISNPLGSLAMFRDKLLQSLFMSKHQISEIASISYRGELKENYWEQIVSLSPNQKFIIKMARGNQGIGVNLVVGLQSLKSLLETFHAMKDQRFLIQPYIEHKKEWRVFVIKNEIIATIEKTLGKEDFRGNSKRSTGKILKKMSSANQAEIIRVANLSGLDYCGIDLIIDNDQLLFLEINPVPGFKQVEELSGINIARELITKIIL